MYKNYFIRVAFLFSIVAWAFSSCDVDEQIPVTEEFVYTMSLDVALSDYDTPVTRSGYDWPDGAKLYLRFANVSRSVAGYARYSKSEDSWSVATSEALFNIDSARCEAYYFKDFTVSDAVIVPLSESSVVYQDTCGSYVKADNDLAVSLSLSPKTGRIRFKGEPGRKFTVRGLYRLSGYDILENRFDSTNVELSPTIAGDGYTPYYYVFFSDTSRTLNVVDDSLWYERNCPSVVLASGKSGYMDVPTEATHNGWIMLYKTSVVAEAVDLGLSVKWASWNVGATAPEDYGEKYAWGEIDTKTHYDTGNYEFVNNNKTWLEYVGYEISGTDYDVAHMRWGDVWRMPTKDEVDELINRCSWQSVVVNGVKGRIATGPNGNTVFFPYNGTVPSGSPIGYYRSGTSEPIGGYNFVLEVSGGRVILTSWPYVSGALVRPVIDKEIEVKTIAEVLAGGELLKTKTQGTIVATYKGGFLIHDDSGYISVARDNNEGYTIGDIVSVCGKVATDETFQSLQFAKTSIVETIGTTDMIHPELSVWDNNALANYLSNPSIQYVEYTGTLELNNSNYYVGNSNSTSKIHIVFPNDGLLNTNVVGNNVTVTGYVVGVIGLPGYTQFVNVIATDAIVEYPVAEAVDLGLSVKWASWNMGASAPEEYGCYYAWGETEGKEDYSWSTYKYCAGSKTTLLKYCMEGAYGYGGTYDNKLSLESEDDVAHVKWGDGWHMPHWGNMTELLDSCSWQWTTVNGVDGYEVTGPSGNSIFLPAAGNNDGNVKNRSNMEGIYWSTALSQSNGLNPCGNALYFVNGSRGMNGSKERRMGYSVRPVKE